jgi:hypothetical protein
MAVEIGWDQLASALRLSTPQGKTQGSEAAQRALEMILGEETVRAAVDYYIAVEPGYELARSVLWLLRPWSAMARCHELAAPSNDIETRRSAVELLAVVADRRALPWVSEFLDDGDPQVQGWAVGVLDQMVFSELIEPEEAEEVLKRAERHESAAVREQAESIRGYLRDRERKVTRGRGDGRNGSDGTSSNEA